MVHRIGNLPPLILTLGRISLYRENKITMVPSISLIIMAFSVKPDLNMVLVASTSHLG